MIKITGSKHGDSWADKKIELIDFRNYMTKKLIFFFILNFYYLIIILDSD